MTYTSMVVEIACIFLTLNLFSLCELQQTTSHTTSHACNLIVSTKFAFVPSQGLELETGLRNFRFLQVKAKDRFFVVCLMLI